MRDGCVVYRPSGNGLGLLLVPRSFGLLVVGFCPTAAGADAKRQGVAVGDVVQAAVTAAGEETTAAEAKGEELLRLCLQQTPRELRLCSGLRFRDKLPLLRLQPGAAEDAIIRALLESHARVEQRLNLLKEEAARGNLQRPAKDTMDRIVEGIQECEGALEVLELIACDVLGIRTSSGVSRLYDQAQELLLQHRREQQTADEDMNGQAEEPGQQLDATQIDTEEQEPMLRDEEQGVEERKTAEQPAEQEQPPAPAPATPARGAVRARVFTSPQSSPPPEEAADDNALKEQTPGQRQPEPHEQNGGDKPDGDLPVVKTELNGSGAKQQQSASSWSGVKSGRRDEDDGDAEAAADRAAKRARCLLIDLTLDDDDDENTNDNTVVAAPSPRPLSDEEHSRDSVVHYTEQANPPPPQARLDLPQPAQRGEDDVSAPHSPASNSSTRMGDGGDDANDAPGDTWNWDAPEEATAFSGAADTQSQFTEMTHDSLPADDPEYEPSQEIDMKLLSQSPRTTRSSVGPSQETPDRGRRTNLAPQMDVAGGDLQIENEPEYYRAFICEHEYCRPARCEMARAMLKHCRKNIAEAIAAMRTIANEPMEQSQTNARLFKDAFFQCGEDFDAIAHHINSRTRNKLFTTEEIIGYFYNVFKPSRTYVSTLKERKLSGKL